MKKINREQLMNRVKLSDEELAKVTGGSWECEMAANDEYDVCVHTDCSLEKARICMQNLCAQLVVCGKDVSYMAACNE